ncbi:MAG: hypothetical protein AABZ39_18220 [Spirochaetota bacterium]
MKVARSFVPAFFVRWIVLSLSALQLIASGQTNSRTDAVHAVGAPDLAVSGTITAREEIWDRRTNPLMGRPDILVEIVLHVAVEQVIAGKLPPAMTEVVVSVKERAFLIQFRTLTKGQKGKFHLVGSSSPFILSGFEPSAAPPKPLQTNNPKPTPFVETNEAGYDDSALQYPEKIPGRVMVRSKELQNKVVAIIAAKYGMKNASLLTLVSFSGPCPPDGGYVYWGVKGEVKGKWHVWQSGRLTEGATLTDPQRYNKCNSPDTRITTPIGPAAIHVLCIGDTVISDNGKEARIIAVSKVLAVDHRICRVELDDGTMLEISPGHPTAAGRAIGTYACGDMLEGRRIIKTELVPYRARYTYDILPDSPSGIYFANGIRMKSTLAK